MSLADYLAKHYLTADNQKKKKRKRKPQTDTSGLLFGEDVTSEWGTANLDDRDSEDQPAITNQAIEFQKAKKNNWTRIGQPALSNEEQITADAVIASAAAENKARNSNEDEQPQVVSFDSQAGQKMESGASAGLQSGKQVSEEIARRKKFELQQFERDNAAMTGKATETIYRDASGRIINVAMKRAEARRKAEEEEKRRVAELEALKGDVQIDQRKERQKKLSNAKYMSVARYADDIDLNEELRQQDRWNDPAAPFLTRTEPKKSVSGRPLYKGSGPQNRYGIRPGHKWDGVDRSNGFEKEYFAARNRRQANKDLEYAWQMDE